MHFPNHLPSYSRVLNDPDLHLALDLLRTPNAKAATRLEINFGTFCKKGLECTGRPAALGGDGTCTKKFHLNSSELAHVEGVKAHNRQVTKE